MEEIFLPVEGFEGLYDVSNKGNVWSYKKKSFKELQLNEFGRPYFIAWKNYKHKLFKIHRLVYETFVGPIPKGYDIHHIDHNILNNSVENLQILPIHIHRKMHYEEHLKPICKQAALASAKKSSKTVLQYTLNGEFVAEYESTCEASRQTGINQAHISDVCLGKRNKAGGFVFKYKEVA